MRQQPTFDFRSFLYQSRCPATMGLIIANAVIFLFRFFSGLHLEGWLAFSSSALGEQPWSLLTYPLVSIGIYDVVLGGYMLFLFGGSLERAWGTPRFLRFFMAVTGITSLSIWMGSLLLHTPGVLVGLWIPLSAVVVAWCLMNLGAVILLFFVLPIQARYLAWLDVAFTYFGYGSAYGPWLAFFALAGCGYAYLSLRGLPQQWFPQGQSSRRTGTGGRTLEFGASASPRLPRSWNPVTLFQRWQRKRRFKRLWENSGMEEMFRDSDPDKR